MSAEVTVVLLRPKEDGNVGAVARVLSNFDVHRLVIVAPRAPLGEEARRRSMAGLPLLKRAKVEKSLAAAIRGMDLVVGTTDLSTGRTESYLRRSITPEEWGHVIGGIEGKVAIVFGPEDNGLNAEELARCDVLVWIPTAPASPTLNLSHATAIVLYATYLGRDPASTRRAEPIPVRSREKEVFLGLLREAMKEFRYPEHKREKMVLLYRRLLGRAMASEHEYTMMMGLLRRILYKPPTARRKGRKAR